MKSSNYKIQIKIKKIFLNALNETVKEKIMIIKYE